MFNKSFLMDKKVLFDGKVEVIVGDITTLEVDAIVNPANTELILGGGVSGAILKAGGSKIQEECDKLGHLGLGEVGVTSGGNLKARFILHAATLSLGTWATQNSVKKALHNALEEADKLKLQSIAVPALGAGIGALPISKVAAIFYEELKKYFSKERTFLQKILIVLYDKYIYDSFINTIEETEADGTRNQMGE